MFSKKTGFVGARLDEGLELQLAELVAASGLAESVILRCAIHDFFKGSFQKRKEILRAIEYKKRFGHRMRGI